MVLILVMEPQICRHGPRNGLSQGGMLGLDISERDNERALFFPQTSLRPILPPASFEAGWKV